MKTFDQWWSETYGGKFGDTTIEKTFREVGEKSWNALRDQIVSELRNVTKQRRNSVRSKRKPDKAEGK